VYYVFFFLSFSLLSAPAGHGHACRGQLPRRRARERSPRQTSTGWAGLLLGLPAGSERKKKHLTSRISVIAFSRSSMQARLHLHPPAARGERRHVSAWETHSMRWEGVLGGGLRPVIPPGVPPLSSWCGIPKLDAHATGLPLRTPRPWQVYIPDRDPPPPPCPRDSAGRVPDPILTLTHTSLRDSAGRPSVPSSSSSSCAGAARTLPACPSIGGQMASPTLARGASPSCGPFVSSCFLFFFFFFFFFFFNSYQPHRQRRRKTPRAARPHAQPTTGLARPSFASSRFDAPVAAAHHKDTKKKEAWRGGC
jgi:hypothetical protein